MARPTERPLVMDRGGDPAGRPHVGVVFWVGDERYCCSHPAGWREYDEQAKAWRPTADRPADYDPAADAAVLACRAAVTAHHLGVAPEAVEAVFFEDDGPLMREVGDRDVATERVRDHMRRIAAQPDLVRRLVVGSP